MELNCVRLTSPKLFKHDFQSPIAILSQWLNGIFYA